MLHPHDPFIKQEARRATSQQLNQTRNKAFRHGQRVNMVLSRAIKEYEESVTPATTLRLAHAAGQALGYAELRDALTPDIATDGLTRDLKGKARKWLKTIEDAGQDAQ